MARKPVVVEEPIVDPSGWMLDNSFATFLLMNATEVQYMCLFGYTFVHGCKVFASMPQMAAISYKFVSFVLASFGGGIIVPIFINVVPVPLVLDAVPIALIASFTIHHYFPIVREIFGLSTPMKVMFIVLFEIFRAGVVVRLTMIAAEKIPPSQFSFPIFGPMICGAIAGCGGAFLPLNKGLEPIKAGLAPPMLTALLGAAVLHIFVHTSLSEGVIEPKKKVHVAMSLFFIVVNLVISFRLFSRKKKEE